MNKAGGVVPDGAQGAEAGACRRSPEASGAKEATKQRKRQRLDNATPRPPSTTTVPMHEHVYKASDGSVCRRRFTAPVEKQGRPRTDPSTKSAAFDDVFGDGSTSSSSS